MRTGSKKRLLLMVACEGGKQMSLVRAIIVEDSEDDLLLILRALKKGNFAVTHTRVQSAAELAAALDEDQWQLVIADHAMPRFSAPEALEVLNESGLDLPFIIVSGTIGEEVAVAAMKTGAHDYIMKNNLARLAPAVERELREAAIREESRRSQAQLAYLTLHDALTGLYNRPYFENELERLQGGSDYPLAIITADISGLKLVNEAMGQREGDRYLQVCAQLINKSLRRGDILARVGGDEFAAIMPRTTDHGAGATIESIHRAVDLFNQTASRLPLIVSLGYAVSSHPDENLADTYRAAEKLLRLDKQNRSGSGRSQVVQALLAALAERDYIAGGHAARMEELCQEMGSRVGLDRYRLGALGLVAQVHDLGKIGVPDQILFKDCGLSDQEWEIMHQHPEKGYRIACSSPDLEGIAEFILYHHEKYDGTGYPRGLKGEEIPLECRILSIVDAFDAMTNDRPYRRAMTAGEAVAELKKCAGTQFDPGLVEIVADILARDAR